MASKDYFEGVRKKLKTIEKESDELQSKGNYFESLEKLDEALHLSKDNFGEDSEEFQQCANKLCETCNLIAMVFQQKENFDACFDFLRKADLLAQNSLFFRALTYNNIACFYKTVGKLRVALYYLNQALEIENKLNNQQNIADIHQNICAVLSQLNKHQDAQVNAMNSIILIQDEMLKEALPLLIAKKAEEKEESVNQENEPLGATTLEKKKKNTLEERITIQSIAYHNLAVEQEYLHKYEDCLKVYTKAYEFSSQHLGQEKQVSKNLKGVLQSAQNQIKNKKAKKNPNVKGKKMEGINDKVRKTNLLANHPFSDEKEGFRKTNNLGNTHTKKMGATYGNSEKMAQTRLTQNNNTKPGMNSQTKNKANNDNEKYLNNMESVDMKDHNMSKEKVNESKLREHASTLSKKEDMSELADPNVQNPKWENMISNRDDHESDTNMDSVGPDKNKLNQDPNPSDDEEEMENE